MLDLAAVEQVSPEIELNVLALQVVRFADSTGWSWILSCHDPEGCHARVELVFHYQSSGVARELRSRRVVRLAPGAQERMGHSQTPAASVEAVDRVDVQVIELLQSDTPEINFGG